MLWSAKGGRYSPHWRALSTDWDLDGFLRLRDLASAFLSDRHETVVTQPFFQQGRVVGGHRGVRALYVPAMCCVSFKSGCRSHWNVLGAPFNTWRQSSLHRCISQASPDLYKCLLAIACSLHCRIFEPRSHAMPTKVPKS